MRSKPKRTAWTKIEIQLVFMFMKSTGVIFPGIWNSNPGDKNANSDVAIIGAAQSFIFFFSLIISVFNWREEERKVVHESSR